MWTLPVLSAGSLITIRYSFKFWVVLVKILFLAVVVLVLDVLEEGATCCFLLTIVAEVLSVPNQQNDGFQKGRSGIKEHRLVEIKRLTANRCVLGPC